MKLLGIDIGGTKTSVCIGDERGTIAASRRIPTLTEQGPETSIGRMIELARELLREQKTAPEQIDAIGLSVPGPMSVKAGMMLAPPNMAGWVNVPVLERIRKGFGRPTFLNNDANACVLAEFLFGEHKGTRDLVYLTMSTGLGAGLISNGALVQGATDLGGEVGHHVLDIHGPACPCGQRGCWELYCGGLNVANRLRERIAKEKPRTAILELAGGDPAKIDFRAFTEAVRGKDPFALDAWAEYIERLAQGIGTVIQFMNPSVIVLGTIAIHCGDLLLGPLHDALPRYGWAMGREACRIVPSTLGTKIGDLSALAVAVEGLRT